MPQEPQIANHVWKSCQDGQDDRCSRPHMPIQQSIDPCLQFSTKILPTLLSKLSLETLLLLPTCWSFGKMFWWKVEGRQIKSPQSSACTTQPAGWRYDIQYISMIGHDNLLSSTGAASHIQQSPHPGLRILASGGRVTSSTSKEPRLGWRKAVLRKFSKRAFWQFWQETQSGQGGGKLLLDPWIHILSNGSKRLKH